MKPHNSAFIALNALCKLALVAPIVLLGACGGGSNVSSGAAPTVTSVTPLVATANAPTTFAVVGTNLPTTSILIPQDGTCAAATGSTATGFSQQCTFTSAGQKSLVIAVGSGYSFNVNVAASQYVKVCNDGSREGTFACPANPVQGTASNEWACTLDTLTNQMWEVKTTVGLRNVNNQYTSFDDTTKPQKFVAGVAIPPTQLEIDASTNVVGYASALNDLAGSNPLCGSTKWRVPTLPELTTLVKGTVAPRIDAVYFPNTGLQSYITATPQIFPYSVLTAGPATSTNSISVVDFNSGVTNTFVFRETPRPVRLVSAPSPYQDRSKRLSAGGSHTCAVKADNTVVCWGAGTQGQLGQATLTSSYTPVGVKGPGGTGLLQDISQVAAGDSHTCALKLDGTAWCWGQGAKGQLGNGAIARLANPFVSVGDNGGAPLVGALSIASGESHSCAITASRQVVCWGANESGQLGNGAGLPGANSNTAVVVSGLSGVQTIAASGNNTCTVKADGTLFCWGHGTSGALGNLAPSIGFGQYADSRSPVNVFDWPASSTPVPPAPFAGATGVSTNFTSSCAVRATGTISCWGEPGYLGDGRTYAENRRNFARDPVIGISDALSVVSGIQHGCALKSNGQVNCWGFDFQKFGLFGSGTFGDASGHQYSPVAVSNLSNAIQISASYLHTCALKATGKVACWGRGSSGQLGNQSNSDAPTPVEVVGLTL